MFYYFSLSGLKAHWAIYLSNTKDVINRQDLYEPVNAAFTTNRFGHDNSAIRLSNGRYRIPGNFYTEIDFTFLTWIKINQINNYARLFEFANARNVDEVFFIPHDYVRRIFYAIAGSPPLQILDYPSLTTDTWNHVAVSLKYNKGFYYVNGVLTVSGTLCVPSMHSRMNNFIGGSSSTGIDPDLSADLDDIKFYNRALTQEEILSEYLSG